ncbi:MAG: Phenylacetic acid degradation-related protein, partial [Polaromonas sp.]|nr:Phenylacetic acid degradation-related protein [Polaromonas sp.]
VTIEMKTSFMRPAPGDGHPVKAKGRLIHRTATMAFTEGTLYDAQDQICAHATGTFKYVKHPAAGAANGGPPGPVPTD